MNRRICNGCGGYVGIDCFNPDECEWIAYRQKADHERKQRERIESLERRIRELEEGTKSKAGITIKVPNDDLPY